MEETNQRIDESPAVETIMMMRTQSQILLPEVSFPDTEEKSSLVLK